MSETPDLAHLVRGIAKLVSVVEDLSYFVNQLTYSLKIQALLASKEAQPKRSKRTKQVKRNRKAARGKETIYAGRK
jgi:hypothetical protein